MSQPEVKPTHSETWYKPGEKFKLVLDFYADTPEMINWCETFPDGSVGEADSARIEDVNDRLNREGWSKLSNNDSEEGIIMKARRLVKTDTLEELYHIRESIQVQIDNSNILGRTEKLLLGEAMLSIEKAAHLLKITKVEAL